jgi:hypothetical protein
MTIAIRTDFDKPVLIDQVVRNVENFFQCLTWTTGKQGKTLDNAGFRRVVNCAGFAEGCLV